MEHLNFESFRMFELKVTLIVNDFILLEPYRYVWKFEIIRNDHNADKMIISKVVMVEIIKESM